MKSARTDNHPSATQSNGSPITRQLIPGLLFGFVIFLILVLIGDLKQVGDQVRNFHWQLLPVVLALTLWNYLLRFIKWHFFLGQVGVQDISILDSARMFVAGFPLAVTPAKVGETLKGVWLNRSTGISSARGISVVVAERISDGLAMLVLSTVGVIAFRRYWPTFALVLGLLLGVIVISQIRPLAQYLLNLASRLPLVKRFSHSLQEFYDGSFALYRPWTAFVSVSLGTISWLAEGIGFYLILTGLGVASGIPTLSIAIFIFSFSSVIGALSALPGGLLATDASIAGLLILLLDLDTGTATAATLLIRFATLWFGVGLGLITWSFSRDFLSLQMKR